MGRGTAAVMATVVLVLSGCGTALGGDNPPVTTSGASSPAVDAVVVPATLAEAKLAWAQARARQQPYSVAVSRRCTSCEQDFSSATVDGGSVEVGEESTPGLPTTVDELLAFVERAQSGPGEVQAVYDRRGVPLGVSVDPNPSVTDDETVLGVSFEGASAALLPPGTDDWTRASDNELERAGTDRAAWIGTDGRLYLVIGGSGSCPPRPGLLTPIVLAGASAPSLFLVDDTQRLDQVDTAAPDESIDCTADLKSYLFSTAIPAAGSASTGSTVPQVMFESGDAERVTSQMAIPWP